MHKKLKPNYFFHIYTEITKEWLLENNIKTILADLDGTLVPQDRKADKRFEEWFEMLKSISCELIIVSNNNKKRVSSFVQDFPIEGLWKCNKPFGSRIQNEILNKRTINKDTTLFLGDQLFTDVWVGKKLGVRTAFTKSLSTEEPLVTKIKRGLENYLLKKMNFS